jgi:hypothetical protein
LNHRANRCCRYKNNRDATTNNAERVAISKNDEWWWRERREKRDGRSKEIGKRRGKGNERINVSAPRDNQPVGEALEPQFSATDAPTNSQDTAIAFSSGSTIKVNPSLPSTASFPSVETARENHDLPLV